MKMYNLSMKTKVQMPKNSLNLKSLNWNDVCWLC